MKTSMSKGKQIRLLLIFLILPLWQVQAATIPDNFSQDTLKTFAQNSIKQSLFKKSESHHKITAIIFALLTGPLGGHRIYLGTSTRVPLIYTATLGGFGTLVIADIIAILVSKDLSKFQNNDKIFMWISSKQN